MTRQDGFFLVQRSYHNRPRIISRSKIASAIQTASLPDSMLTKDEGKALKQMKTDEDVVILSADKGRVTAVMDKTDYFNKMDTLVNDI